MTLLTFILIGLVGQLAHYVKKWSRNEIECNLHDYVMTHKKHTVGAVVTMIVAIVGLFGSSTVIELTGQSMALAFFAGYSADSAMNKAP